LPLPERSEGDNRLIVAGAKAQKQLGRGVHFQEPRPSLYSSDTPEKNSGVPEELIDQGQLLLLLGGLLLGRLLFGGLLGLLLRSHGFNSSIVRPGPSDSSPPPKNTNNMNYLHFELQI
jgi:hypothetical protein